MAKKRVRQTAKVKARQSQHKELKSLFGFAIAVFMMFVFYAPSAWTGVVGHWVRLGGGGLLGVAIYVLPLLLVGSFIDYLLSADSYTVYKRCYGSALILLTITVLISIFTADIAVNTAKLEAAKPSVAAIVSNLFWHGAESVGSQVSFSGGVIGGVIALGANAILGQVGALILFLALLIALIGVIFDVSIVGGLYNKCKQLLETQNANWQERKQQSFEDEPLAEPDDIKPILKAPTTQDVSITDNKFERPGEVSTLSVTADVPDDNTGKPEFPSITASGATKNKREIDWGWHHQTDNCEREVASNHEAQGQSVHSADVITTHVVEESQNSIQSEYQSLGRDGWEKLNETSVERPKPVPKQQTSLLDRYTPPPLTLLKPDHVLKQSQKNSNNARELGAKLERTLTTFGVEARVVNFTMGPTITRFELQPGEGVKVSKIVNLTDDIALNLAAANVRIEAPIPGKAAIGIEVPNKESQPVLLRGLLESTEFQNAKSPLTAAIGRDIQGNTILCDLARMPHLLIAGATGAGKSVCINTILMSLLFRATPQELRLVMIDPKVVELSGYNGIPHLLQPVVTDPKKAYGALNWATTEMDARYTLFATHNVRDIGSYNEWLKGHPELELEPMPSIVIVIDELADLMATSASEVENEIARLTSKARAAGLHLIIATQRPSVDVITGVIKANIPSRIAFAVASQVDSRTILDSGGAEKLLGKGDLLYYPTGSPKPIRGQGAFVSDSEVEAVLSTIKSLYVANYDQAVGEAFTSAKLGSGGKDAGLINDAEDELLNKSIEALIETGYGSASLLQRRFGIGYPRAARLIDRIHALGYIGPHEGSKPRKVLVSMEQYLAKQEQENEE